jgi:predicted Holliday junction resolvase-like endonuclease
MITGIIIAIVLFIMFIWLIIKSTKPKDIRIKDLEARLKEEFYEKEQKYRDQINELKLKHQDEISELEREHTKQEKVFRQDAVKRSRNTLMGRLWETVAPYLPKFKYSPSDMRFIGSPIDYIIFRGMNKKKIDKVVFLEIKSGDSKLTEQEERLKATIKAGKVSWEEFRIK